MLQSQRSGFMFENIVRTIVFNLKSEKNSIQKYDIPKTLNRFNPCENISIKSTCSNNIDCSDILRIYDYDMNDKNTIIVIKYKQVDSTKVIENIFEIDFNYKMWKLLFGEVTRDKLTEYINFIKDIKPGKVSTNIRNNYIELKKDIEMKYSMKLGIRPKVDSKNQRRVQCSISNFEQILDEFIISKTTNVIRSIEIPLEYQSLRRIRNMRE